MTFISLSFLALTGFLARSADAQPVYFESTGHYYEWVDVQANWYQAEILATTFTHRDVAGHLATSTSQEENDFIMTVVLDGAPTGGNWLGGRLSGVNWEWVTGEPWGYESWYSAQPSGLPEWALEIGAGDPGQETWNDENGATRFQSYIVEYPTVPEPGDVDWNRVVDGLDLTAVLDAWDTTAGHPRWNPDADLDCSGIVDGLDLTEVISNWTTAPGAGTPIPEPATLLLVALGALGLLIRKRH